VYLSQVNVKTDMLGKKYILLPFCRYFSFLFWTIRSGTACKIVYDALTTPENAHAWKPTWRPLRLYTSPDLQMIVIFLFMKVSAWFFFCFLVHISNLTSAVSKLAQTKLKKLKVFLKNFF